MELQVSNMKTCSKRMSSRYDNDRRRLINTFLKNLQDLSNLCYLYMLAPANNSW